MRIKLVELRQTSRNSKHLLQFACDRSAAASHTKFTYPRIYSTMCMSKFLQLHFAMDAAFLPNALSFVVKLQAQRMLLVKHVFSNYFWKSFSSSIAVEWERCTVSSTEASLQSCTLQVACFTANPPSCPVLLIYPKYLYRYLHFVIRNNIPRCHSFLCWFFKSLKGEGGGGCGTVAGGHGGVLYGVTRHSRRMLAAADLQATASYPADS